MWGLGSRVDVGFLICLWKPPKLATNRPRFYQRQCNCNIKSALASITVHGVVVRNAEERLPDSGTRLLSLGVGLRVEKRSLSSC